MNCAEYRADLEAALDSEATRYPAEARKAHVRDCATCAEETQRLHDLRAMLGACPDVNPPADMVSRVLERCSGPDPASRARPVIWRWGLPAAFTGIAAAAALAVGLVLVPHRGPEPHPVTVQPLTPDQAYALDALRRAGRQVSRAERQSGAILDRLFRAAAPEKERM